MSNENIVIAAQPRDEFGKGAARRLRREARIPGVIYGQHLENPIHFHAALLEVHALLRRHGSNAVFELDIEGDSHLVIVKHVDQNVLTLNADHIDLVAIKRGEKVEVEVPVVFEGETASGTQLVQELDTILVEADVLSIPEELVHSVEGLEGDTKIQVSEIALPAKTTLVGDPEAVIASVNFVESNEEVAEDAAGEAEEAAEGEAATEE